VQTCYDDCLHPCGESALADYPGHPPTNPDISGADISARDKAVADDALKGVFGSGA